MKQTRDLLKNSGSTQAMRFIQSFSNSELDASKPDDWKKANQMGMELAQKIAPNNQFAVYTHLDGKGHKLHNHLVMNMPDLKTGKKYNHDNDWQRVSKLNDEVIKSHGLTPLDPTRSKQVEKKTMAERQLQAKNEYIWKDDLRNQIDQAMSETGNGFISSKNQFSDVLKQKGIIYRERGKNSCSFEFRDKNDKLRRIRGTNLGTDYTKGAIKNGLESKRTRKDYETSQKINRRESVSKTRKSATEKQVHPVESKVRQLATNLQRFIQQRIGNLRRRLERNREQTNEHHSTPSVTDLLNKLKTANRKHEQELTHEKSNQGVDITKLADKLAKKNQAYERKNNQHKQSHSLNINNNQRKGPKR